MTRGADHGTHGQVNVSIQCQQPGIGVRFGQILFYALVHVLGLKKGLFFRFDLAVGSHGENLCIFYSFARVGNQFYRIMDGKISWSPRNDADRVLMTRHDHVVFTANIDAVIALIFGCALNDLGSAERMLAVKGISIARPQATQSARLKIFRKRAAIDTTAPIRCVVAVVFQIAETIRGVETDILQHHVCGVGGQNGMRG